MNNIPFVKDVKIINIENSSEWKGYTKNETLYFFTIEFQYLELINQKEIK